MRRIAWSIVLLLTFLIGPAVHVHGQSEREDIDILARSVVQVATYLCNTQPPQDGNETETPIERGTAIECSQMHFLGSGTVIDHTGTILTNDHLVRPWEHGLAPPEAAEQAGWYLVLETVDPRQSTRPAFFARVDAANADLDLAILVPFYSRDGQRIEPGEVEMSAMRVARPQSLELGEPFHLLGYAESVGSPISYSTGTVSGFRSDERVPALAGEAWIRTDATLLPAGSGGAAVDSAGYLVGVPTWNPGAAADEDGSNSGQPAILRPVPEALALLQSIQPRDDGVEAGVTVTGRLVSADTGDPIDDGRIIILKPGVSATSYAENPQNPEAVYAGGKSNEEGRFVVAPPVLRNQSYNVIIVSPGFLGKVAEGRQFAGAEDRNVVDLGEIRMQSAT